MRRRLLNRPRQRLSTVMGKNSQQRELTPSRITGLSIAHIHTLSAERKSPSLNSLTNGRAIISSDITSSRTRLESSTSSRFFPGGWFNSSSKVPEESRASLETATGQFVPSKGLSSPVDSAPVLPSITTTNLKAPANELGPHSASSSSSKKRWCNIM